MSSLGIWTTCWRTRTRDGQWGDEIAVYDELGANESVLNRCINSIRRS